VPEDLAAGIECILRDEERWHQFSDAARAKAVATYDARTAAQRHVDLYQSLCGVSVSDRPCAIEVA
jgi:glycosyltransferase involved in cell wall biosynthesis